MKAKAAFDWPAQQRVIKDQLARAIEALVRMDGIAQTAIGASPHKQQNALCDIRQEIRTVLNVIDR
jgi:hypothetical protein